MLELPAFLMMLKPNTKSEKSMCLGINNDAVLECLGPLNRLILIFSFNDILDDVNGMSLFDVCFIFNLPLSTAMQILLLAVIFFLSS